MVRVSVVQRKTGSIIPRMECLGQTFKKHVLEHVNKKKLKSTDLITSFWVFIKHVIWGLHGPVTEL